jgi:hypothetical protein
MDPWVSPNHRPDITTTILCADHDEDDTIMIAPQNDKD